MEGEGEGVGEGEGKFCVEKTLLLGRGLRF
jgi:hypothetical protein